MAKGNETSRKWTLMVYMVAGNDAELDAVAVEDLKEMESGIKENPSPDAVNVVVQINRFWPATAQRYHIHKGGTNLFSLPSNGPTDMAKKETLTDFLRWVLENSAFEAEHYALVLWGHAYGLGYGRDHGDKLTLEEISQALKFFCEQSGRRLDILGANACAMSYIEAAYQLRDGAAYMVASQITVPFAGWPYKTILSRVGQEGATEPDQLGRLIVDAYAGHYNALVGGDRVAMSLLNLGAFSNNALSEIRQTQPPSTTTGEEIPDKFDLLIDKFAKEIARQMRPGPKFTSDTVASVRDIFLSAAAGEVRPLVDLVGLCRAFEDVTPTSVPTALKRLLQEKLVIRHRAHPSLDDLNGIGIFAPFVTDMEDLRRLELQDPSETNSSNVYKSKAETGKHEYQSLKLFDGHDRWPRLVYEDLATEISAELLASVTGIAPVTRQDRRDIAQIVVAIDSAFNKLDRIIEKARKCVRREVDPGSIEEDEEGLPVSTAPSQPKQFRPPWLKLIGARKREVRTGLKPDPTVMAAAALLSAEDINKIRAFYSPRPETMGSAAFQQEMVTKVTTIVDFFVRVEKATGDVERATRKGLTHARFGLAPTAPAESGFFAEEPKSGEGLAEEPKSGEGLEEPKSGEGPSSLAAQIVAGGDLRVDRAFLRVSQLFRQVGRVLTRLEQATLSVELTARDVLTEAQAQHLSASDLRQAAADEIERGFRILSEASMDARRTVRRVMSHPMYGLGPGSASVGLEQREALANAGGLSRSNLRLL